MVAILAQMGCKGTTIFLFMQIFCAFFCENMQVTCFFAYNKLQNAI